MSEYQKKFTIPVPAGNWDEHMQHWLLTTTDQLTLDRYLQIYHLHESIVAQADVVGDRNTSWIKKDDKIQLEIKWKSDDVHMTYMNQIPLEDRLFYEKCWDDYHEYIGTNYKCVPK